MGSLTRVRGACTEEGSVVEVVANLWQGNVAGSKKGGTEVAEGPAAGEL